MDVEITACLTNWDQYQRENRWDIHSYVRFPLSGEEMRKALKTIGVDGIRARRVILTDYNSSIPGFCHCLAQYDSVDEVNYLARLLSGLSESELDAFRAVLEYGEHNQCAADLINLALNLDCYEFHPGVDTDEDLGRVYADFDDGIEIPENVLPYFDYEAYGRDIRLNEGGCFVNGGYLTRTSAKFLEQYHGPSDIPPEYRVFSYPKLTIREKLAAYKEANVRAAPDNTRPPPERGHDGR